MKKIFLIFLAIAGMAALTACGITDEEEEFEIVPSSGTSTETTAEFDHSYFGLYKGIIAGPKSSGTVKIEIYNGNNDVKAFLTIGNQTDELTYTIAYKWNIPYEYPAPLPPLEGLGESIDITFTGAFSLLKVWVSFQKDYYGREYYNCYCEFKYSGSYIEGHENPVMILRKETSDNVVTCCQGTATDSKGNKGVFNVILDKYDSAWIHRGEGEGMYCGPWGLPLGNTTMHSTDEANDALIENEYKLKFSNGNLDGTWKAKWPGGSNEGVFTCKVPVRKIN